MSTEHWSCLNCETENEALASECSGCKCPASILPGELQSWRAVKTNKPVKPSSLDYGWSIDGGSWRAHHRVPCPKCHFQMYLHDTSCPHCYHELDMDERKSQIEFSESKKFAGVRMGLFWFVFVLGILLVVYSRILS